MEEKRKNVTSTEVKRRYNQKVYSQISFSAPKELVEEFRGICRNVGISQASVFNKLTEFRAFYFLVLKFFQPAVSICKKF